eukprot:145663-Chlamydomonas_euryale.AAC.1
MQQFLLPCQTPCHFLFQQPCQPVLEPASPPPAVPALAERAPHLVLDVLLEPASPPPPSLPWQSVLPALFWMSSLSRPALPRHPCPSRARPPPCSGCPWPYRSG